MSFIGVTYRSVGEGLPAGTEMTQRQLCHRSHPALVATQKSWKPGIYRYNLQAAQQIEDVCLRQLGLPEPFPDSLVDRRLSHKSPHCLYLLEVGKAQCI